MKIILSICTILLMLSAKAQVNPVEIHFKKNIEFFGYIIELGDPSDNDPTHPISRQINKYPENRTNKKLFEIFSIAGSMDYATIINLMYYLPDLPLEPGYNLPAQRASDLGFESKEDLHTIRTLVEKINDFYLESKFDSIYINLEPYRAKCLGNLIDMKPPNSMMKEIEEFYGTSFNKYEIVPSLTIWSGPGWGIANAKRDKASFILGPLKKNYVFRDEGFKSLTIHEFGHSFVNHVVLQNNEELKNTESLFPAVKSDMIAQGYSNWETCMIEHFVRAGEVIIMEQMGNQTKSEVLFNDYHDKRKFIYLSLIVQKLREYRIVKKLDYQESVTNTLWDLERYYLKD